MKRESRIPGFYKLTREERIKVVKEFGVLSADEEKALQNTGSLGELADRMIENIIGTLPLPLGIATNFLINGKDYLIPMAIEEPSVVAAASNGAKIARGKGGFFARATEPIMIGQVQIVGIEHTEKAKGAILAKKKRILEIANAQDPLLVKLGGGAQDVKVRIINAPSGKMVIVHLLVNVKDAMGANTVNTMAEAIASYLERLTGGRVYLRIISNLAKYRLAYARAVFDSHAIGGEEVVDAVMIAYEFATADPYRCATHNKGIMNGVDAVVIATGNDFRAVEAGAHSYACLTGEYLPLTKYKKNENGDLVGEIELPLAIGIVGGATKTNPTARANLKLLGISSANELAEIIAAVGLAQNLAAVRALATEGIQHGHMRLHARNIAVQAGAKGEQIDEVAAQMIREKKIRVDRAKEILEEEQALHQTFR